MASISAELSMASISAELHNGIDGHHWWFIIGSSKFDEDVHSVDIPLDIETYQIQKLPNSDLLLEQTVHMFADIEIAHGE